MFREIYKTLEIDKRLVVNGRVEFAKDTVFNYDEDLIVLVQLTSTEEELEQDCWKVMLAAGMGRNLLVFDSNGNGLTTRLLGLMQTVNRRNSGKWRLTKFFARKSKLTTNRSLVEGVVNDLGGEFPNAKSNLIIGISEDDRKDVFVTPKVGDKYGVACLSSNNVLLGAF